MRLNPLFLGGIVWFITFSVFAQDHVTQESIPQVGKHVVGSNLDIANMLLSLLAVLVLIIFAASLLKKFHFSPQLGKELKVITSLHLGPKERLVVVEINKKQLLLGVTAHHISILQTLEKPIAPAQTIPINWATSFSKLLKKQ